MGKKYEKNVLESYEMGSLIDIIFKVISAEISEEDSKREHISFQKRVAESYLQKYLYSFIDDEDKKNFYTELNTCTAM